MIERPAFDSERAQRFEDFRVLTPGCPPLGVWAPSCTPDRAPAWGGLSGARVVSWRCA